MKHGEFKAWIEKNCECSYRTAAAYMKVAKSAVDCTFDGATTLADFLEAHASPRAKPAAPEPTLPTFDRTDAEHVMKLRAMVERGGHRGFAGAS